VKENASSKTFSRTTTKKTREVKIRKEEELDAPAN